MSDSPQGGDNAKKQAPAPVRRPASARPSTRRDLPRLVVHERCLVELFVSSSEPAVTEAEPICEGVVINISPRGMGLLVSARVYPGSLVVLRIHATKFARDLRARVVWCADLPTTNRVIKSGVARPIRMGLQFELMNEDEKAYLSQLVAKL